MKILRYLLLLIFVSFAIFIIWMNVTPGHFQRASCSCIVTYMTKEEVQELEKMCPVLSPVIGMCILRTRDILLDPILTLFSLVDFYK
ncbi:MAG: hypothetical protein Q7S61_04235 [bacterium]|nr:hypothetical protein [bacterium]